MTYSGSTLNEQGFERLVRYIYKQLLIASAFCIWTAFGIYAPTQSEPQVPPHLGEGGRLSRRKHIALAVLEPFSEGLEAF